MLLTNIFLINIALLFLALNSIFCKMALANEYIDPYSFTFYRLFFGALTLLILYYYKNKKIEINLKRNWLSSFMLFLYAISFSYAYLSIDAGFGTLLLFGVVQVLMLCYSFFSKEKFTVQKIFGTSLAFIGLLYLLYPRQDFELSYFHVFLMLISGLAWAVYTIIGKKSVNALFDTQDNFFKASIFAIIFYFLFPLNEIILSFNGLALAFISGSLTSAIGYLLWYKILPKMEIFTASIIQLFVPVISIILSIVFLDELLTSTLIISSIIIFCGILLAIFSKKEYN